MKIFNSVGIAVTPFPVSFKTGYKYGPHNINNPYFWIPNSSCLNLSSIALREIMGRVKYHFGKNHLKFKLDSSLQND